MRLITRSDFDGLVCGVLLVDVGVVDSFKFVHPKDIQDGKIEVTENDVLANVPYVPGCGMWFDHHSSEWERLKLCGDFYVKGRSELAPSCARVIYHNYGGEKTFSHLDQTGLMDAVDRSDSATVTCDEVMNPTGWILLSFLTDPRTGLGRFKDYRISNYQLMENLIEYCRTMTAEEILALPDVKERIDRYFSQEKEYEEMLKQNATIHNNVLVINLLNVDPILSGNRFKEYVIYPHQNISIRAIWGFKKQNIVFTCGYSVFNRTATADVGGLMLKYGGGGHKSVGTCQIPTHQSETVLAELIDAFKDK